MLFVNVIVYTLLLNILKRSRDFLLYTKKATNRVFSHTMPGYWHLSLSLVHMTWLCTFSKWLAMFTPGSWVQKGHVQCMRWHKDLCKTCHCLCH